MSQQEEKLSGGNVSQVYRVEDTVRREIKPESERIHKLLKHLEEKGFLHAPRFMGIDEKGREVLSYLNGEAGNYPLKSYMWSDEVLIDIAKMLRGYHDAVSDFPFEEEWEPLDDTPGPYEFICHNDFAIYNIIFHNKQVAGIIDFDVAAPGPRVWDVAYALYTCVPLGVGHLDENGEAVYYEAGRDAHLRKERIDLFFKAYGMEHLKEGIVDVVKRRVQALQSTMKRKAAEGDEAFQRMIDEGHYDHYERELAFIKREGHRWVEE
ncbi:aminoglycoside phosphotransferase [Rossellomorea marisflavi]|uniref:Aminoglycoside phosphotransferase n=1 Tax=Rossellomorea marisflavi TaxID=189381 RepID=A0A0M0G565_9BACI|nr:aminoglycoside phosphotransferase family protein [Rossellomorea marisflavi]KON84989.1 aminoglycoside phosphotransferase [Rossellomorea marisflavi]